MSPSPDFIQRSNATYIEEQYERYKLDPGSVTSDWAAFFAGVDLAGVRPTAIGPDTWATLVAAAGVGFGRAADG